MKLSSHGNHQAEGLCSNWRCELCLFLRKYLLIDSQHHLSAKFTVSFDHSKGGDDAIWSLSHESFNCCVFLVWTVTGLPYFPPISDEWENLTALSTCLSFMITMFCLSVKAWSRSTSKPKLFRDFLGGRCERTRNTQQFVNLWAQSA